MLKADNSKLSERIAGFLDQSKTISRQLYVEASHLAAVATPKEPTATGLALGMLGIALNKFSFFNKKTPSHSLHVKLNNTL